LGKSGCFPPEEKVILVICDMEAIDEAHFPAFLAAISVLLSSVAIAAEQLTAEQMDTVTAGGPYGVRYSYSVYLPPFLSSLYYNGASGPYTFSPHPVILR
jgi:hypothetical protein